jgi:hypothetical protein
MSILPPQSTSGVQQLQPLPCEMSKVVNATLIPTTLGETETKELAVVTATSPVEKLATKPTLHLRRFDNVSLYSLTSLKDFTVSREITDWIKYKLSSGSKKGSGFSTTSNADHISKVKFVVMFAISKAKELAPESYNILLEKEPHENDPAHAAWGFKISNAAKVIKDKLVAFLLEAKAEVEALAKPAAKKQRRSNNFEQDLKCKPTIAKVREIINELQLVTKKV